MADRSSGAYIYSQISGGPGDSDWSPRYIDITASGIDNISARNRLMENAIGGAIGTYTAAPTSKVLQNAYKHKINVFASHHTTYSSMNPVPGTDEMKTTLAKASAEYMKKSYNLTELPPGLGGTMVHGKPAVLYYKDQKPTAALFTGNITNTSSSAQQNYYLASKDTALVADIEKYFQGLSSGRIPSSAEMRDLIVSSPTDRDTLVPRINKAFAKENSSETMYVASATLTSSKMLQSITNQLRRGGTVKLVKSNFVDGKTQQKSEEFLNTLTQLSELLPGKLMVGESKDNTKKTHLNTMVQGETFLLGSARMSNSVLSGEGETGTETSLIAKNRNFVKQIETDLEKMYTFKEVGSKHNLQGVKYSNQFVNWVNTQHLTRNIDILIPAQMNREIRKMYRETGSKPYAREQGVLTNAFIEYATRNPTYTNQKDAYNAAVASTDYAELMSIQQDWFNKTTWGETWGQLGNRGVIGTALIRLAEMGDNQLSSWVRDKEAAASRFYKFYKAKPLDHSTPMADVLRLGLDYFSTLETNLLMFNTATTMYSTLMLGALKFAQSSISTITGLTEGTIIGSQLERLKRTGIGNVNPFWMARAAASEMAMNLFAHMGSVLDVMTGASGDGSWEYGIEKSRYHSVQEARSHRDLNRITMHTGYNFTQKNPMMRMFGVSLVNEVYLGFSYWKNFGFGSKNITFKGRAQLLKYALFYDLKEGTTVEDFKKNPAMGVKFSGYKTLSVGILATVMIDQFTGYIGTHVGGIDAARVDRANQILRDMATSAGNMHPVQIARTSNVGVDWTGNKFVDTVKAFVAGSKAVGLGMLNLVRNLFNMNMTNVLGVGAVVKGRELEAAQEALAKGDEEAAIKYALLADNGSKNYSKDLIKGDMWKTWVFQISNQPLIFTYTWSLNQHIAKDSQKGLIEVQEFGYTLQGPVALRIGMSTGALPFRFFKQLNQEGKQRDFEPWVFQYTPGTSWIKAVGVGALIATADLIFRGVAWASGAILNGTVKANLLRRSPYFTGAAKYLSEQLKNFAFRDLRYMNQLHKVGTGGAKVVLNARMGVLQASMKIMSLVATLPIYMPIMAYNLTMSVVEQGIFASKNKTISEKWMFRKGTSDIYTGIGSVWEHSYKGAWFINSIHRDLVRELLNIQDLEDFHRKFGDTSTEFSKLNETQLKSLEAEFADFKKDTRSLLRTYTIRNPWNLLVYAKNKNVALIPKLIVGSSYLGLVALTLVGSAMAFEAGTSVANGFNIKASLGFKVANSLTAWAASNTEIQYKTVNSLKSNANAEERITWLYKALSKFDKANSNLWPMLQAVGKMISSLARMFDSTGSGVPNFITGLAGATGEFIMNWTVGLSNVRFDPVQNQYVLKDSAQLYKPGWWSGLSNVLVGGIQAVIKGTYLPFGMDSYGILGVFGITKTDVDKDTSEWASTFSQASVLMILSAGYAEKYLVRDSKEKRQYNEWKYTQKFAYESMGLRVRSRERAIRSGKMYHDNVIGQATSWGMRVELARRAELMRWIKNVDPRDILAIPGLVSVKQSGKGYDIRRFKDPTSEKDAVFANLARQLSKQVFENVRPGLGDLATENEQIDFDSALMVMDAQGESMGPGGIAPTLVNRKLLPTGTQYVMYASLFVGASLLAVWKINPLRAKVKSFLGNHASKIPIFGETLSKFINDSAVEDERRRINILRTLLPDARMFNIGRGLMFLEIDGVAYHKGPYHTNGNIIDLMLDGMDAAPDDLRRVGWVKTELEVGSVASFMRILNRYEGFNNTLRVFDKNKTLKVSKIFHQLQTVQSALEKFKQDALELKNRLPSDTPTDELKALDSFMEKLTEAQKGIDRLLGHYADVVVNNPNMLDEAVKVETGEIVLSENGRLGTPTTLRGELNKIIAPLVNKDITKNLTELMIKTGQITRIDIMRAGKILTNGFKNFLLKFKIDPKLIGEVSEALLNTNKDIVGVDSMNLLGAPGEGGVKPGFLKFAEFDAIFQSRMLENLMLALKDTGINVETFKNDVRESLAGRSAGSNITGKLEKMLVDTIAKHELSMNMPPGQPLTKEILRKFLEELVAAGKLDGEAVNTLLEGRLDYLWKHTKVEAATSVARGALFSGTEITLFGKSFEFSLARSVFSGGLRVLSGIITANYIGNILGAAYYSDMANNPQLNKDQRAQLAIEAENLSDHHWGFTLGALGSYAVKKFFTSSFMKALFSSLAKNPFMALGAFISGVFEAGAVGAFLIGTGIFIGIDKLLQTFVFNESEEEKIVKGADPGIFTAFNQTKSYLASSLHNRIVQVSKDITKNYYKNSTNILDSIFDFILHKAWDPAKFETPHPSMIWTLVDPLLKFVGTDIFGNFAIAPSMDPKKRQPFLAHSAIFVGTSTIGNTVNAFITSIGISEQHARLMAQPDSWAYQVYHPTLFGMQSQNKVVGANKDGSDPLNPGWLRDDFRHAMFREQSTVLSAGMEAALKLRGHLEAQIMSNLVNQKKIVSKIMLFGKENLLVDPRSGGVLPGDTYLIAPFMSTSPNAVFHQPDEAAGLRHPMWAGKMSHLRGKTVSRSKLTGSTVSSKPGRPTVAASVRKPSMPIVSAMDVKMDPLLRALHRAAQKIALARTQATDNKTELAKGPVYMVVPDASIKPSEPEIIASDTFTKQHCRDTKFSDRTVRTTKQGVVLDAYRVHDKYEIEMASALDTMDTDTNKQYLDTCS